MMPRFRESFRYDGPELGRGGASVVRSCARLSDGARFAVKVTSARALAAPGERASIAAEVAGMRRVTCPGIVRFVDAFEDAEEVRGPRV